MSHGREPVHTTGMTDKVVLERLPETKEQVGAKRWVEERGQFVQIAYQEEIRHLALFEIKRGFTRGSHYHRNKEEIFYVVRGKINAIFLDLDTGQRSECILEEGVRIRIKPNCGHLFFALEDAWVVEYSPQVYDIEDNYRLDL